MLLDFPPLGMGSDDKKHEIRQDLHRIRRTGRKVKSANNIRGSIRDSKIYDTDFSQLLSSENLPWDSSDYTDVTVQRGSKSFSRPQMNNGEERHHVPKHVFEESKEKGGNDAGGILILDVDDDFLLESLGPITGLPPFDSKELNPSASALSDSFYSTTSNLFYTSPPSDERSRRLRKHQSFEGLSKLASNIKQSSFISRLRPNSPFSPILKNQHKGTAVH
jgi:hypothetical protein